MGTNVLHEGMIQVVLGLSEDQTKKMNALKETYNKNRQEMMDDIRSQMQGGGDRESMREAMTEMRESMVEMRQELEKNSINILSEAQQKQFNEMKGETFEFPQRRGRRGGRLSVD